MDFDAVKLVLAGPVGAGKTTEIRSIADTEPISTEMPLVDGPMGDKTTTTVAFDFATVMLDDDTPLLVYGLPGQEHFEFMRNIVIQGALGVVILLDGQDPETDTQCEHWLRVIRDIAPDIALVIGITKTDIATGFSMGSIRAAVRRCGPPVPAFTFDARSREESMHLIRALLVSIEA